jgi:ABC-type transport system involved in Fe-S cluster assembly fused permease/ATPase subunit
MAQLCFGVGIEEEGAVKLRRGEKRGTRPVSWVCESVLIAMCLRAFVVLGSVIVGLGMRHCFSCLSVALCVCVFALYVKNWLLSVSRSGCTF